VAQYTSLCSEKFREVQSRVEANLEAIRPNQEYKDFTEKHKYSEYLLNGLGEWLVFTNFSFLVNGGFAELCQEIFICHLLDFIYVYTYDKIISLHE
jgi:hypothetical protein